MLGDTPIIKCQPALIHKALRFIIKSIARTFLCRSHRPWRGLSTPLPVGLGQSPLPSLWRGWLGLPHSQLGRRGGGNSHKVKCHLPDCSTKVQKVHRDTHFSAHLITLLDCQDSEMDSFHCFASIFVVLGEKWVHWGLHAGSPKANLSHRYFVIIHLRIKIWRRKESKMMCVNYTRCVIEKLGISYYLKFAFVLCYQRQRKITSFTCNYHIHNEAVWKDSNIYIYFTSPPAEYQM